METLNISSLLATPSAQSFGMYAIAVGASLVFAYVLSWVHNLYGARSGADAGVEKSFPLLAPSVTAIFLVIQFSLPLSLGLLGALSFVRFRTPIKEPEEIGFILLVIASSLACAVFRFEVSLLLCTLGLVLAWLKTRQFSFSPYSRGRNKLELFITSSKSGQKEPFVLQRTLDLLKGENYNSEVCSVSQSEDQVSYHLRISKSKKGASQNPESLITQLDKITSVSNVNLIYQSA